MNALDRWDSLIMYWVNEIWPSLSWQLIKAQGIVESGLNPRARSPAGAVGLLQLMPETAAEMGCRDPFQPDDNLKAGISYLRRQFDHFPEIPDFDERIKFSLAAYNCGRAYVNRALEIYYEEEFGEPMPQGHEGAKPGRWQIWEHSAIALAYDRCRINGAQCIYRKVWNYVGAVWSLFRKLQAQGGPYG